MAGNGKYKWDSSNQKEKCACPFPPVCLDDNQKENRTAVSTASPTLEDPQRESISSIHLKQLDFNESAFADVLCTGKSPSGTLTCPRQEMRLRGGVHSGISCNRVSYPDCCLDCRLICPPCTCRPVCRKWCCLPPQHPCFRSPCYVPDCGPYRSVAPCVKGYPCNLRTPSSPWIPCNPSLPFNPSNPCFGCDIYEPYELPCPCPPPPCCPRLIKPAKPPRRPTRPCSICSPCCGWATTCGPWYRYGPCGPFGPVGPYGPCGPFGPGVPCDPGNFLPGAMPCPPPEPEPPRDLGDTWPPIPPSPCPSMEGTRPPICPDPPCPSPKQPCQRPCVVRRPCSPVPPYLPCNFPVLE